MFKQSKKKTPKNAYSVPLHKTWQRKWCTFHCSANRTDVGVLRVVFCTWQSYWAKWTADQSVSLNSAIVWFPYNRYGPAFGPFLIIHTKKACHWSLEKFMRLKSSLSLSVSVKKSSHSSLEAHLVSHRCYQMTDQLTGLSWQVSCLSANLAASTGWLTVLLQERIHVTTHTCKYVKWNPKSNARSHSSVDVWATRLNNYLFIAQ